MDTIVATYTPPTPQPHVDIPEVKNDSAGVPSLSESEEPIEVFEKKGFNPVLEALNIQESPSALPHDGQQNLLEIQQYIEDLINKKGDSPTMGVFKKTLNEIKTDMGLDDDSDPATVLDRIGGVIKALKSLTFVKDPHQKRSIFMKLAKAQTSSEMNRIVFDQMESYAVWK